MTSEAKIKSPHDSIIYNIGRLYGLLNQYFSAGYKAFGLNPAQLNVLMVVKHKGKDSGISQREISGKLYVTAANITRLIDAVEKKGWVERVPSSCDRRINLIKITREGERLLSKVWEKHIEAVNNLFAAFSREGKEEFNKYLEMFIKEMESYPGAAK